MSKDADIVVAGDVTIDWLLERRSPVQLTEKTRNWRLYPGSRMYAEPGGALLLHRMVQAAVGDAIRVVTYPDRRAEIHSIQPDDTLLSTFEISSYDDAQAGRGSRTDGEPGEPTYRVSEFRGYAGPEPGHEVGYHAIVDDNPRTRVAVLDDAGNGFRDHRVSWPRALADPSLPTGEASPLFIWKMYRPLAQGELWAESIERFADRILVIVSAADLRRSGVPVTRRRSWERTATELVSHLSRHPDLVELRRAAHLIVRFGLEGALHCRGDGQGGTNSTLYYDAALMEDELQEHHAGDMTGLTSAFVAGLVKQVWANGFASLNDAIPYALRCARRLALDGFERVGDRLFYPTRALFERVDGERSAESPVCDISVPIEYAEAEPGTLPPWRILDDKCGGRSSGLAPGNEDRIAMEYVKTGRAKGLKGVPAARFGKLTTVDRREIESYSNIRNLIQEYLSTETVKRPLCIGVFGPPGAGKSFGVVQCAESIAPGRITKCEFNVAQFRSIDDLIHALHRTRDVVLRGSTPLVFFDEFDSGIDGRELGWLKYFIGPMQDGVFLDRGTEHPIGRAIFVFAGGTCSRYQDFYGRAHQANAGPAIRAAKLPDFISRLRGYIDITGPNPTAEDTGAFVLRRAVLLRSILKRSAHQVFRDHFAMVDDGVLRALLGVGDYRHGVRSMEAIIDMSILADRHSFRRSALPSDDQLALHVDSEDFRRLLLGDGDQALPASVRERLARAMHRLARAQPSPAGEAAGPPAPWHTLDESARQQFRSQAGRVPERLAAVGLGWRASSGAAPKAIDPETLEAIARQEHAHRRAIRKRADWVPGPHESAEARTSPWLEPWDTLDETRKEHRRNEARSLPELLSAVDLQIESADLTVRGGATR